MFTFVNLITLINVGVFFLWQSPDPAHLSYMEQNFAVSYEALADGRYWTLLTSVFSHNFFFHLFINMFVLRSFGTLIEDVLGSRRFITFYLAAGVTGSVVHSLVSNFILHEPSMAAVGASGAIAGLVLLFALMFPREKILLFALIPLPALSGALLFIGLDIWGLVAQAEGGGLPIGHGAHLGGAAAGILYYFLKIRGRLRVRY